MVPAIDLAPVNFVDFIGGSGNQDGRGSGFNDLGQITFSARFTDGSYGVFVSNVVAVPEPSTIVLSVIAISIATLRAMHRK